MYVLVRDRKNSSRNGKNVSHAVHGLVKRARDAVHRSQKEIAEALPREASFGKAVVEKLLHRGLGVRKRHNAVSNIARGKHTEVFAEHPRAAAVIRDGNNRRNVFGVALEPAQHCREPVAAADCDNVRHALFWLV